MNSLLQGPFPFRPRCALRGRERYWVAAAGRESRSWLAMQRGL